MLTDGKKLKELDAISLDLRALQLHNLSQKLYVSGQRSNNIVCS